MNIESNYSHIYHLHRFPHIWKIEKEEGVFIDKNKEKTVAYPYDYIFIEFDEPHCLKNDSDELLKLLWDNNQ